MEPSKCPAKKKPSLLKCPLTNVPSDLNVQQQQRNEINLNVEQHRNIHNKIHIHFKMSSNNGT